MVVGSLAVVQEALGVRLAMAQGDLALLVDGKHLGVQPVTHADDPPHGA